MGQGFGIGPSFNPNTVGPPAVDRRLIDQRALESQANEPLMARIMRGATEIPGGMMQGLLGQQPSSVNRGAGDWANIATQLGMAGVPVMQGLKALSTPSKMVNSLGRMEGGIPPPTGMGVGVSPTMMPSSEFAPMGAESIYNTRFPSVSSPIARTAEDIGFEAVNRSRNSPLRMSENGHLDKMRKIEEFRNNAKVSRGEVSTR